MNALLELADRIEAADGPDRELDNEIHWALFGGREGIEQHGLKGVGRVFNSPTDPLIGLLSPLAFTSAVEIAENTLPGPEWPEWQITRRFCTGYHASVGLGRDGVGCATAALALCAAALRARGIEARQGGDAEGGSVHESPVAEGDVP